MQNRWSETEAAGFVARASCDKDIALLTYATRLLGVELDLAMHGGGNTSCKSTVVNALPISTNKLTSQLSKDPILRMASSKRLLPAWREIVEDTNQIQVASQSHILLMVEKPGHYALLRM